MKATFAVLKVKTLLTHIVVCTKHWLDQYWNIVYKLGDLRKDIDLLEKVQKRATSMIIIDRGLTYGERLKKLWSNNTGEKEIARRFEVFKIFKG